MKVSEFRGVKVGDRGYKISYAFNGQGLHIFQGIVHEIEDFGKIIYNSDHSITLRSELPCGDEYRLYMESFGYPFEIIDDKCYPLSFGCSLYSKGNTTVSYFARDEKELKQLKRIIRRIAVKFATKGL